jgi:hypothetical protein
MPILRFRSVEEMDRETHVEPSFSRDASWFLRVARLWERSARLNPRRFPPGVHRYRTIEAAYEERERWLGQHVDELRAARSGEPDPLGE